jgi:hypothetical protein
MSYLRFHHVFYGLMALAAVTAFVVPARYAGRYKPQVQVLFVPVARPAAMSARSLTSRISPPAITDHRPDPDIRSENEQLRAEIMRLQSTIAERSRRENELGKLGSLSELCALTKVIGSDAGTRDSLQIGTWDLGQIKRDMYVIYPAGMVGQISSVSLGGAQVRLLSDKGFRIMARFCRFENKKMRPLLISPVWVQGAGGGDLLIWSKLSLEDIGLDAELKPRDRDPMASLRKDDYAVVDDTDCPPALQGWMIGRVSQVSRRSDSRLMAQLTLRPSANLSRLSEVMVVVKEQ